MADEVENARPKGLLIPFDKFVILDVLPPEKYKAVITLMRKYVEYGEEPGELEDLEKIAFEAMRSAMDTNILSYQRKLSANQQNGRKGGRPRKCQETDALSGKPKETDGFFEKPTETQENPQKPKYKVQSTTSTNVDDSLVVVMREPVDTDLAKIVQRYENAIGTFPRSALEKLQSWRKVFSTEMVLLAIDKASEAGGRSWRYINGILSNWQRDGVHTPGDVAASDEKHQSKPAKGSTSRPAADVYADIFKGVI